ncbi:hypothetical protein [Halobellus rarus]|uniref:Cox cluster protein n=1 Tax=Halobellus rarus TaxID=1126237 RepID=A0ABD6CLE2_9EURY
MNSDDGGYVHRPGETETAAGARESESEADTDGFGGRGWVLVAVLVVCLLIVPGIIYVRPGILSAIGIPYIASLLVLPLLPAAALGLTAVWAMTAATNDE